LIAVFVAQMVVGETSEGNLKSVDIAGLVKPDTWEKGEYWRILTSGVLHGGLLHIYFNAQAFHGFGALIEVLSNRARMAIVFVLAIIGGAFFSMIFMPEGRTIGASGGIMGLIGYLAIYGYRRKRQLPPNFLRSMLINIGFVAAFGLVAYQIIDNFAHLGGLLVGLIYGFLSIPRDLSKNPREIGAITDGAGMIAMGVIVFISIFTILLITEKIVL
jgi:membrane associated rhomboid family serine protease